MRCVSRLMFNLFILGAIVVLLAACASSGPSAEPPACRGTAFPINTPSPQTAGAQ
jgi:hypothetical protein